MDKIKKTAMLVTRRSLPRRSFLRAAGATIALPLLDAMIPALSAGSSTAAKGVPRLGFFYIPNGVFPSNFHPAGSGGTNFELTPVLQPLKDLRQYINVLTGLSNRAALSSDEGGGVHSRAHAPWLNGVRPKRTEGADITAGKTLDQYAADKLGAETSLRSLELTTASGLVGNCEQGYSCAYWNSTSWRGPHTPLLHERNPRAIFQRLFGDGGSVEERLAELGKDRSILDSVMDDMKQLQRQLGIADQHAVGNYLDSVREVEGRIQWVEQSNAARPLPTMEQPEGVPEEYDDHVKLLMDLLVLAYQGDITRVSCMQFARETSNRNYPHIGVTDAHHAVSHHRHDPHNVQQFTKINAYHMSLYARFLEKLRAIPEGDGTLLDCVIAVWGRRHGRWQHARASQPADRCGRRRLRGAERRPTPRVPDGHAVHELRHSAAGQGRRHSGPDR